MHAVKNSEKSLLYCSLDKENVLNEIMKVSHVSYHVLNSNFNLLMSAGMSDNLTEDKLSKSLKLHTTLPPPPPPLWF